MPRLQNIILSPRKIFFLALIGWFIQWFWVSQFIGHDYLVPMNDVRNYWYKSASLQSVIGPFHVPLYSLLLWFLRTVSFDAFAPMVYMQGLNLIVYFAALVYLYKLVQLHTSDSDKAAQSQLLLIFYPLAGISYVVSPYADLIAITLFLAAVYFAEKRSLIKANIFFALALICHKFMWPLVGLFLLIAWLKKKLSFKESVILATSYVSIIGYWLAGLKKFGELDWIVSSNLEKEFSSSESFYPFKGLVDLLGSSSNFEIVLGAVLLGLLVLILVFLWRYTEASAFGIAVSLCILLFLIILNKEELFVLIRFGKLFIPVALILVLKTRLNKPVFILSYILIGIGSNLALAWYAFG